MVTMACCPRCCWMWQAQGVPCMSRFGCMLVEVLMFMWAASSGFRVKLSSWQHKARCPGACLQVCVRAFSPIRPASSSQHHVCLEQCRRFWLIEHGFLRLRGIMPLHMQMPRSDVRAIHTGKMLSLP